jgi:hypothetical protein
LPIALDLACTVAPVARHGIAVVTRLDATLIVDTVATTFGCLRFAFAGVCTRTGTAGPAGDYVSVATDTVTRARTGASAIVGRTSSSANA